jgi:large subunit ribosomal protein L30
VAAQSVRITQRRSASGSSPTQRDTLRSLGLRGIGKSVEREDGPVLRGMVRVVEHLVDVKEAKRDG